MTNPATLAFKGKQINFDALTKSIKSMPIIELKKADVRDAKLVECDQAFHDVHDVAVYKHENIFYVFCGHEKVNEFLANDGKNTIKARLISKQLFKHLTVVTIPLSFQNTQAAKVEREMEQQQEQRPRFGDSYPERSYGQRPQNTTRTPFQGERRFQPRRP